VWKSSHQNHFFTVLGEKPATVSKMYCVLPCIVFCLSGDTHTRKRPPKSRRSRLPAMPSVSQLLDADGSVSCAEWCVCKQDAPQAALQKTIDYACGAGADCNSIHENGGCYNPNTVPAHCSWASNSYYQNNKARSATCDFSGTATLTTTDPSKKTSSFSFKKKKKTSSFFHSDYNWLQVHSCGPLQVCAVV
jgi:hypothetical protein